MFITKWLSFVHESHSLDQYHPITTWISRWFYLGLMVFGWYIDHDIIKDKIIFKYKHPISIRKRWNSHYILYQVVLIKKLLSTNPKAITCILCNVTWCQQRARVFIEEPLSRATKLEDDPVNIKLNFNQYEVEQTAIFLPDWITIPKLSF